ncbi:thioredoxin reductase (NADPH) [Acetitomaculum ruminis DSM 5522]|uniref:Thioredoxin reductase n=1 Tax=Acetitomaculum ruminis DSM 5522 TaxID=1120918 RepID=A0A1I0XDD6_9FIRM|nr:thioredoxin-disulfide reductase [Acetitomaculum ruminis]SFA98278.1 thioredoxin reductase (NADPH) [Acetitomaculum ruminis DSM 5522]
MYDLIIAGGGPAGVSAAIYAKRAMLDVILVESNYTTGGQILETYEVDNYPGIPGINGFDLGMKFKEHMDKFGVETLNAVIKSIKTQGKVKKVITSKKELEAKAVIIALGASHKGLMVKGEKEFSGKGVSYCATCDGNFYKDGVCAVVGGGDVALEDAIYLSRICKKVYLIHRRDEFRGAKSLQEVVKNTENIQIIWDSVITEICGDDTVSALKILNKKTNENSSLEVEGLFIATGIVPNTIDIDIDVEKDSVGYIVAQEDCKTSKEGIFAAGDIRTKRLRQVITAASDGANAVTSVEEYLQDYDK